MNYEDLQKILKDSYDEYDCIELEDDDGVILMKEGRWTSEGKYEYQESVYADKDKTVFCAVALGRSGSYFTDWDYADPEYYEVVPTVVTRTIYKAKK